MDRLKQIFLYQEKLINKIHEGDMNFFFPVDIDSRCGQTELRATTGFLLEELGEALAETEAPKIHEELIDGLHFLTELTILAGRDYNNISMFEPDLAEGDYLEMFYRDGEVLAKKMNKSELIENFVIKLTAFTHTMKNKPWKKTFTQTDSGKFYSLLEECWIAYFGIMVFVGLTPYTIADGYLRKQEVNIKRQESGY